jgi:hypothetical protein
MKWLNGIVPNFSCGFSARWDNAFRIVFKLADRIEKRDATSSPRAGHPSVLQ